MNALNKAAETVNNSWCKGNLLREEESRDGGNTYCAAGALALAVLTKPNYVFSEEMDKYGPEELLQEENYFETYFDEKGNLIYDPKVIDTYEAIGNTIEGQLLAETIKENYPELIELWEGSAAARETGFMTPDAIIWRFNDHPATCRTDVISMMEKAAVKYDELIALEDKTTDDLVAEINELIAA